MKIWIRTSSLLALIFESGLPSPDYLWKCESGLPCPDYLCKFGSGVNPHVVIYFISGPSPSGLDPDTASGMEFNTSLMYVLSVFENSNFTFRGPLL